MEKKLKKLEDKINYNFKKIDILISALTHNERVEMYKDMIPTLKFNQQHLLKRRHVWDLDVYDWQKYSMSWKFD